MVLNKKVSVLLATYNGEKYLDQQIESLFEQTYSKFDIIARDDFSTDSTLIRLKVASRSKKDFNVYGNSENIGPVNNFFLLLSDAPSDSHYYAFSDQDDVWLPEKLSRAINKLEMTDPEIPCLYCSALAYTNNAAEILGYSNVSKNLSFENALVENVITGCTIVINKSARDLVLKNIPKNALMHDAWLYLLISSFGEIIYDKTPSVLYRQHANNYFGAEQSVWRSCIKKIRKFFSKKDMGYHSQALEFYHIYGPYLEKERYKLLKKFIHTKYNFLYRIKCVFCLRIYRQKLIDNILFRLVIIFNKH